MIIQVVYVEIKHLIKNGTLDIDYCVNSGNITGTDCGGICGPGVGYSSGVVTISNCENSGTIGNDNGGICGPYASHRGGTLTIDSCGNTGVVNLGGGGICGAYCCGGAAANTVNYIDSTNRDSGDVTITNCSNSGEIKADNLSDGTGAGGIVGRYAARGYDGTNDWNRATLIIESCSNSGMIKGTSSNFSGGGGICGSYAFYSNELTTNRITNCSNTGEIKGRGGGGICGSYCCNTGNDNIGNVTIEYCYSTGKLTRDHSGGIVGAFCGGTMEVKYCYYNYTTDDVTNNALGGIVGSCHDDSACVDTSALVVIFNCYSIFNRDGSKHSGGIAGRCFGGSIYNCYHTGSSNGNYAGGILGPNVGSNAVVENCYYVGDDVMWNTAPSTESNNYVTDSWDDTYAYYTIGQGTVTDYKAVRWYNNRNTDDEVWLIGDGGGTYGGDFESNTTLEMAKNAGANPATLSDLKVIFGEDKIDDTSTSNTYILKGHITINNSNKAYFPISIEDGMTFDGGNYTITYEGDTVWTSLFEVNSSSDFTLQNTQFNLASGGLKPLYGCFFHSTGIIMGNKTINVINCSSVTSNPYNPNTDSGMFIPNNAGGIFGDDCANNGTVNLTYCYNEIPIKPGSADKGAGGLVGSSPTLDSGTLIIKYCYNSGDILSNNCGGLIGQNQKSGTVIIFNCYNTGNGNDGSSNQGGLIGKNASSTVNIYNCWSSGIDLSDAFSGSNKANVIIKNCYSVYIGTGTPSPSNIGKGTLTNTYKTDSWDDTYAYYTIGQDTGITGYDDIRWNNDNTTEWIIHNNADTTISNVFGNEW